MTINHEALYTIAYINDMLIALAPDGEDIAAEVAKVEESSGENFPNYVVVNGVTLTDEIKPSDRTVFASPNGSNGFLMVMADDGYVTYDYAVRRDRS